MENLAALRAQWFVQLAEAIASAQQVAWQLGTRNTMSGEARELYGRLEAARIELDSLRGLNLDSAQTVELDWLRKLGWREDSAFDS